jgi:hypothetical protein
LFEFPREICFGQRGALIGKDVFFGEQGDASGKPTLAQGDRDLRTRLTGSNNDHASHDIALALRYRRSTRNIIRSPTLARRSRLRAPPPLSLENKHVGERMMDSSTFGGRISGGRGSLRSAGWRVAWRLSVCRQPPSRPLCASLAPIGRTTTRFGKSRTPIRPRENRDGKRALVMATSTSGLPKRRSPIDRICPKAFPLLPGCYRLRIMSRKCRMSGALRTNPTNWLDFWQAIFRAELQTSQPVGSLTLDGTA